MKVLGMLFAMVPFGFAGIRLLTTGTDLRYLWMAVGSTLCAVGVLRPSRSPPVPSRARIAVATIAAAACAAAAAILLGATSGPGVAIVAVAFGFCGALGTGLVVRSRPRGTS